MITAIIPAWKRFTNLERVIQSWLDQEEIDEVIVFDNSGKFKLDLPNVLVINASRNLKPEAKLVAAQFAKNDILLFSDDDVIAKEGLIKDLLKGYDENTMVGIMGKNFIDSDDYYDAKGYRGHNIGKPLKVDYLCGLVMLVHRKHTFVDVRKCPSRHLDDWWWQREIGNIELYVMPTDKYKLLPEQTDENALHRTPELKKIRQEYYMKWIRNA